MKKNVIAALIFFVAVSTKAQDLIGIQGGVNFANLSNPGNLVAGAVWTTRAGIVGGAFASVDVGLGLFLQPEIRFVQKGTDAEFDTPLDGHLTSSVAINYIEVPLYLKYRLFDWKFPLSIIAGPAFSHLMSSIGKMNSSTSGNWSGDVKDFYKAYDISADAGVATQYQISSNIYVVGSLMYSFGLVKISTMKSDEMTRDIRLECGISYALSE